jgi:peroxiredoxin
MAPASSSRWVALAFVGAGLLFGLAAGAVIFFGLPAGRGDALSDSPAAADAATSAPAPVVGAPAPNFTLESLAGDSVTLADLRGQVVLLNFWATWCGPCEAEMPAIEARYKAFGKSGLAVLAINLAEPEAEVQAFVDRLGLTFTILMDPSETVFDLYRVRGYPTTFIVDREGMIIQQRVGFMSDGQLDQYLLDAGFGGQ